MFSCNGAYPTEEIIIINGNGLFTERTKFPRASVKVPTPTSFTTTETAGTDSPVFAFLTDPLIVVVCAKTTVEKILSKKNSRQNLEVLIITIVLGWKLIAK